MDDEDLIRGVIEARIAAMAAGDARTAVAAMRSTLGLRKQSGEWKIVHGHTSVPFQTDGSFTAALDLTP